MNNQKEQQVQSISLPPLPGLPGMPEIFVTLPSDKSQFQGSNNISSSSNFQNSFTNSFNIGNFANNLGQSPPNFSQMMNHSPENGEEEPPFTLEDDLTILKSVKSFYGASFDGKLPQSFWKIFIKTTESKHSERSLMQHWNGSMMKKYQDYISSNKLTECIQYIQEMIEQEKPIQPTPSYQNPKKIPDLNLSSFQNQDNSTSPNALIHTQSHQGLPPEFEQFAAAAAASNNNNTERIVHSSRLIRCKTERPHPIDPSIDEPHFHLTARHSSRFNRNFTMPTSNSPNLTARAPAQSHIFKLTDS